MYQYPQFLITESWHWMFTFKNNVFPRNRESRSSAQSLLSKLFIFSLRCSFCARQYGVFATGSAVGVADSLSYSEEHSWVSSQSFSTKNGQSELISDGDASSQRRVCTIHNSQIIIYNTIMLKVLKKWQTISICNNVRLFNTDLFLSVSVPGIDFI